MNATTMVLLLMGGVSACLGSAQIDWEKFYKGDSDEVRKVSSIRALAATNCIRTIESAQQFVQVVPDYVAHMQGFWRTNGPQRLTIRGQKHYRYEISMALDVWSELGESVVRAASRDNAAVRQPLQSLSTHSLFMRWVLKGRFKMGIGGSPSTGSGRAVG